MFGSLDQRFNPDISPSSSTGDGEEHKVQLSLYKEEVVAAESVFT